MDHNINTTTALWSPSKARRWLALAAYPLVWAVNRPSAAWLAGAIYDLALRCNGIAINYEGQYGLTAAEERFLGRIAPQIKGGVVFDVGANVGAYSQALLRLAPGVEIHAFEPHPSTFARLAARLAGQEVTLRHQALSSMVTPYSLEWRPLPAHGSEGPALRDAGSALARLLRGGAPLRLEAMEPAAPGMVAWLGGLRSGGMALGPFQHFGNWREVLPPDTSWLSYWQARPPALRNTIQRKLARAERDYAFSQEAAPGAGLERGINDFVDVRGRSWKPQEPFPAFDAALLRAMATIGALRLGLLRDRDGRAVAAQYWLVDGNRAYLLKLVHDAAAAAASPGTALTALMIRGLIETDGVRELDFGRGDDAYKQLWVAERRQRMGVMVTDPWHPAGMLELARQGAARGKKLLRRIVQPMAGMRA